MAEESPVQAAPQSATDPLNRTGLLIGGIVLIALLIVAGLFLPPISLGQRLGGQPEPAAEDAPPAQPEAAGIRASELDVSQEITLSAEGVTAEGIGRDDFLKGNAGAAWAAAAAALPANTEVTSNIYALRSEGQTSGSATITLPAEAGPIETLDLYGWNGQAWHFVPSEIVADGGQIVSVAGPLPQALALMQVSAGEPTVSAEVQPEQTLPTAVLPHVTEVTAGWLDLSGEGTLTGETAEVPTGGYRQLLGVTAADGRSVAALLDDAAAQAEAIEAITGRAAEGGFAGVNLDWQGVDPAQRDAFSSFVGVLAEALHGQQMTLAVTVGTPAPAASTGWDTGGQDWLALGQAADALYVQMPLDPTMYADNGPAEKLLAWAVRYVSRTKVTMVATANAVEAVGETFGEVANDEALANFGQLDFIEGEAEVEPGTTIEVGLSGTASALEWDATALAYRYSYEQDGETRTVWLSNEAAVNHRLRLGAPYRLRGVALRGLGTVGEGSGYAATIQSYLGAAGAPQPVGAAIVWTVSDSSGGVLASSSGDALTYEWQAAETPGEYVISAAFAQGEAVASLGELGVAVMAPPTPTATPTPEPVAATPAAAIANAGAYDPGNADAVTNIHANARTGPGVIYSIIQLLDPGTAVDLIGRNSASDWYQAVIPSGEEAWIYASLLNVNANVDTGALAVVAVEPPAGGGGSGAPPPAVAPPAAGGIFELGGQTHTLANPVLMQSAGMTWVKFQHKWSTGDSADAVAGRIAQAHGNGFKVLLSMPGSATYPSSIDYNAYVDFLGGVAALGPDAIEVWNEMNIDFEWPAGQIDPTSYVTNMLAPAYNRIKSVNPNVMVISGAPAPTGCHNITNCWADNIYMQGVAAAGGGNYMDCVGVHHNAGATSPYATSGHTAGAHYSWYFGPTVDVYYNAFGGSRKVCLTELGYLSSEGYGSLPSNFSWAADNTVAEHAQWLAEAASLSSSGGKVRMMIVFNVDFTFWGPTDPQAGYAMIRPDGSCPACGTLGAVMGR